jgi:hypothetical protein
MDEALRLQRRGRVFFPIIYALAVVAEVLTSFAPGR